ncbi:hypothetical protein K8R78_08880 [bacterium]|nr:hypothetical protein [bacterium]
MNPRQLPLPSLTRFIREQLRRIVDDRRWRVEPEVLRNYNVDIEVLWNNPPQSHLLIKLSNKALFYLPLYLSSDPLPSYREVISGVIEGNFWYMYDPFHHPDGLRELLARAYSGNAGRLNFGLPERGKYAEPIHNALVNTLELSSVPLEQDNYKTTHSYRYRITARSATNSQSCLLKRYLPRFELERGHREWNLSNRLATALVPQPLGRLYDVRSELVLAGFYEEVQGDELELPLWRIFNLFGKEPLPWVIEQLELVFGRVFAVLRGFYQQLHSFCEEKTPEETILSRIIARAERDFKTLTSYRPSKRVFQRTIAALRDHLAAGELHGPQPIHGNLNWHRMIWHHPPDFTDVDPRVVPGRITLTDPETIHQGFLEEDLAGLAAASNSLMMLLKKPEHSATVFSVFWQQWFGNEEKPEAVRPLLTFLRLRHLHIAAHYAAAMGRDSSHNEEYDAYIFQHLHAVQFLNPSKGR